jgi:hypothetical protein
MFLGQDERLLLFHQRPNPLSRGSLESFRDAGIKTIHWEARYISWHEIEPEPGVYNWDVPDRIVQTAREVGLKSILDVYWRAPDWVDGCLDIVRNAGTWFLPPDRTFPDSWRAIDPFNEESMKKEAEFLELMCCRYSAPDVLCRYAMHYGGERIIPFGVKSKYDEQFCIDTVVRRQRIFAEYGSELWTAFHPLLGTAATSVDATTVPYVGNEHISAVYSALVDEFPDHTLNIFITEFWPRLGTFEIFDGHKEKLEVVKKWVGAQFIDGVKANSRRVSDHNLWGLIMAHKGIDDIYQPTGDDFRTVESAVKELSCLL